VLCAVACLLAVLTYGEALSDRIVSYRIVPVSYRDILCDIVSYRIVSLMAVSCHHYTIQYSAKIQLSRKKCYASQFRYVISAVKFEFYILDSPFIPFPWSILQRRVALLYSVFVRVQHCLLQESLILLGQLLPVERFFLIELWNAPRIRVQPKAP